MNVKFLYGESTNLESTARVAGQILFTTDTKKIYWDKDESTRIEIFDNISADITAAISELLTKDDSTSKTIKRDATANNVLEVIIDSEQPDNILKSGDKGLYAVSTDFSIKVEPKGEANPDAAKTYTITQTNGKEGTSFDIDIPKDKVIKAGELVTITDFDDKSEEYQAKGIEGNGTYLKVTIDNDEETEIYIDVNKLIDVYTAKVDEAGDVKVTIEDHEISAALVDSKVVTAKIADQAVTEAKLAPEVVAKIGQLEWNEFTPGE